MPNLDIRDASVSLLDFLPDSISADPEIRALSKAIDQELRLVSQALLEPVILPRISSQPEAVLDALAWGFGLLGVEGWDTATLARKRVLMAQVVALYRRRGTRWAVRRALDLLGEAYTLSVWHETPPSPEWSYRLQILVGGGGLPAAQVARARELVEAYGQATAWPEEISALLAAEAAETITVQCVSIGVDLTVAQG